MSRGLTLKNSKSPISVLQTTFNKYSRKIELLTYQIEQKKKKLEEVLIYYHKKIKPKEKEVEEVITNFLLKISDITNSLKNLTKKEHKTLCKVLEESLHIIFSITSPESIHETIHFLRKEVFGKSYQEEFFEELSGFKESLKDAGYGDIDISNLDPSLSFEELMIKFAHTVHEAKNKSPEPIKPTKSKKETLKEQKARELEALQKKGLNNIYKRLVKVLHPDLEQNEEMRLEKEAFMKRLTVAYEKQDILTLLALESQWLTSIENSENIFNEETLKAYNTLLKEQIRELNLQLRRAHIDARFIDIQKYIVDESNPMECIEEAFDEYDLFIEEYNKRLQELEAKKPLKKLKEILAQTHKEFATENLLSFGIDEFFDFKY